MNNSSRPGSPIGINNNAHSVTSNVGSVASLAGLKKNLRNINAKYIEVMRLGKEIFPGENATKKAKRKANGKAAYEKKRNATRKSWLASHGMPRNVNAKEAARINKEAREYAMRLYGHNIFQGGKRRSTRKNRR